MRINPIKNNFYSPSFSSRKKEVKDADHILRRTKQVFPLVSPTYIDSFYGSIDISNPYAGSKSSRYVNAKQDTIAVIREMQQFPSHYQDNLSDEDIQTPYGVTLSRIKKDKAGNCLENSIAALTALYANGYTNSNLASVKLKVGFQNPETGEIDAVYYMPMDHSVAVTDMNKGGKKNIVIDPWLNFADTKDRAIAKYKSMYEMREISEAKSWAKYYFGLELARKNSALKISDYIPVVNFELLENKDLEPEEIKKIQAYAKKHFEELLIKN